MHFDMIIIAISLLFISSSSSPRDGVEIAAASLIADEIEAPKNHSAVVQVDDRVVAAYAAPPVAEVGRRPIDDVASSSPRACGLNLTARVLWASPLSSPGSPFVGAPRLAPILRNSNSGQNDYVVVAAAFHGEVSVLSASDGRPLPNSRWPIRLPSSSIYSSPLLHDVDVDGALDVVVVTGEGVIHAFQVDDGANVVERIILDPLVLPEDWFASMAAAEARIFPELTTHLAKAVTAAKETTETTATISLEPVVMATPTIADLNGDGRVEEMIIPVTYSMGDHVLTSLLVVNLTSGLVLRRLPLELSSASSEFPAYLLDPPTVVDLDSRPSSGSGSGGGPDVEILIASTSGRLFAFDAKLESLRTGFPIEVDAIVAPVVTHDLTGNGRLEIVLVDRSGIVHCFDTKGNRRWETSLDSNSNNNNNNNNDINNNYNNVNNDDSNINVPPSRHSSSASSNPLSLFSIVGIPRVFDFDDVESGDEIGVVTEGGVLYVLGGVTGRILARHAIASAPLASGLLVTRVIKKKERRREATTTGNNNSPDLLALSTDGHLHVVTSASSSSSPCHLKMDVGESTLTSLLSADFVASTSGHEILVATQDGLLMALTLTPTRTAVADGRRRGSGGGHDHDVEDSLAIPAWEWQIGGEGWFGFVESGPAVVVKDWTKARHHITGDAFSVAFDVGTAVADTDDLLRVKVYLGSILLAQHSYSGSGFHLIRVPTPDRPIRGHLILRVTNQHGQVFQDVYPLSLNETLLDDLRWVLLVPFLATCLTYIVVHGYPEEEVLPTTVFKGR